MTPRQSLTRRCPLNPPATPPMAMLTPAGFSRRSWRWCWRWWCWCLCHTYFVINFDANVHLCTPQEGPNRSTTPHIAMLTTMLIKMITINMILMVTFSIRREKPMVFWLFFIHLGWSTFKDDKLEEKNYDNDFQSEGKNQWFFDGFVMTMKLHDFITNWSFSIGREISNVFSMILFASQDLHRFRFSIRR